MTEFSHSFVVAHEDIDEQGHVNNVAYVRWIQEAAVAHWFSLTTPETREKFTWVVLRHEIDYKKAALRMKRSQRQRGSANRSESVGKDSRKSDVREICSSKQKAIGV